MTAVGVPMDPTPLGVSVPLADKRLRRIVNMHMVSGRGMPEWEIVHCIGEMSGGERVLVELPSWRVPRQGETAALIAMFKGEKRFPKIMNLFEPNTRTKVW